MNAFEIENLMDNEIETHHHEAEVPSHTIQVLADGMPAFGIVAAVMGVVHTMASVGRPPSELGIMVANALVGTFLGILLGYGFVGPLASLLAERANEGTKALQCVKVTLLASPSTGLISEPDESERDFRVRNQMAAREARDQAVEELRRKYAPKTAILEERLRRAEQALQREREQSGAQKLETAVNRDRRQQGQARLGALGDEAAARVDQQPVAVEAQAARVDGDFLPADPTCRLEWIDGKVLYAREPHCGNVTPSVIEGNPPCNRSCVVCSGTMSARMS